MSRFAATWLTVVGIFAGLTLDSRAGSAEEEPTSISVQGIVVDDETGEPIEGIVIQGGRFDPETPDDVTWGFTESRSSRRDGRFRTNVRWSEGWTARVLADGYLPQPVLDELPPDGKTRVEVVLRLKRGRFVRGHVVTHSGDAAVEVSVFAVGPTGLNLEQGRAVNSFGEGEDERALKVTTNAEGAFELPVGEATRLAVSTESLDAWPYDLPEGDEPVHIQLPESATAVIDFNVPGAAVEERIFFQLLTHKMDGFEGVRVERYATAGNGEPLELAGLTPGPYQFARSVSIRTGDIGHNHFVDRTFVTLVAGETLEIDFSRPTGARLSGIVEGLANAGLDKALIYIKPDPEPVNPDAWDDWLTTAFLQCDDEGNFTTELIPPGTYKLIAHGYLPLTDEQRFRTGLPRPSFIGETRFEVGDEERIDDLVVRLTKRRDE